MKHRSTRNVVDDLRAGGRLIEIDDEVDPHLEMAEIQRRVYARGGPALLLETICGIHGDGAIAHMLREAHKRRPCASAAGNNNDTKPFLISCTCRDRQQAQLKGMNQTDTSHSPMP